MFREPMIHNKNQIETFFNACNVDILVILSVLKKYVNKNSLSSSILTLDWICGIFIHLKCCLKCILHCYMQAYFVKFVFWTRAILSWTSLFMLFQFQFKVDQLILSYHIQYSIIIPSTTKCKVAMVRMYQAYSSF